MTNTHMIVMSQVEEDIQLITGCIDSNLELSKMSKGNSISSFSKKETIYWMNMISRISKEKYFIVKI